MYGNGTQHTNFYISYISHYTLNIYCVISTILDIYQIMFCVVNYTFYVYPKLRQHTGIQSFVTGCITIYKATKLSNHNFNNNEECY